MTWDDRDSSTAWTDPGGTFASPFVWHTATGSRVAFRFTTEAAGWLVDPSSDHGVVLTPNGSGCTPSRPRTTPTARCGPSSRSTTSRWWGTADPHVRGSAAQRPAGGPRQRRVGQPQRGRDRSGHRGDGGAGSGCGAGVQLPQRPGDRVGGALAHDPAVLVRVVGAGRRVDAAARQHRGHLRTTPGDRGVRGTVGVPGVAGREQRRDVHGPLRPLRGGLGVHLVGLHRRDLRPQRQHARFRLLGERDDLDHRHAGSGDHVTWGTVNGDRRVLSMEGPGGRDYTYGYVADRLETYTDPAGQDTDYTYTSSGLLSQIVDAESSITLVAYDGDGRVTELVRGADRSPTPGRPGPSTTPRPGRPRSPTRTATTPSTTSTGSVGSPRSSTRRVGRGRRAGRPGRR